MIKDLILALSGFSSFHVPCLLSSLLLFSTILHCYNMYYTLMGHKPKAIMSSSSLFLSLGEHVSVYFSTPFFPVLPSSEHRKHYNSIIRSIKHKSCLSFYFLLTNVQQDSHINGTCFKVYSENLQLFSDMTRKEDPHI